MDLLTYHQDPRYPTPILSKAKIAPPLAKGRGWGWGKTIVGQEFELKLTPMGNAMPLRKIYMYQAFSEMVLACMQQQNFSLVTPVGCVIPEANAPS